MVDMDKLKGSVDPTHIHQGGPWTHDHPDKKVRFNLGILDNSVPW